MVGKPQYDKLHNYVCGIAGEGEEVKPESLNNLTARDFMYDKLMLVEGPPNDIVYSTDGEGSICVELLGEYKRPLLGQRLNFPKNA